MFKSDYESRLMQHGAYQLGAGLYGSVYGHDSAPDRVLKVGSGSDRMCELYHQWAAQHGYAGSFAPKVFSFAHHNKGKGSHFWVLNMERLGTTLGRWKSPDRVGFEHATNCVDGPNDAACFPASWDYCEAKWPGFNGFVTVVRQAGFVYDWSPSNWMLPSDGSRLVLTDPQCNEAARERGPVVVARRWRVRPSGEIMITGGSHERVGQTTA